MRLPDEYYLVGSPQAQIAKEADDIYFIDRIESVENYKGRATIRRLFQNQMFKLPKDTRDQIVNFLQMQVVPANVGANLMQVADTLMKLEEIKDTIVQDTK